jgi:hypothetical protein
MANIQVPRHSGELTKNKAAMQVRHILAEKNAVFTVNILCIASFVATGTSRPPPPSCRRKPYSIFLSCVRSRVIRSSRMFIISSTGGVLLCAPRTIKELPHPRLHSHMPFATTLDVLASTSSANRSLSGLLFVQWEEEEPALLFAFLVFLLGLAACSSSLPTSPL